MSLFWLTVACLWLLWIFYLAVMSLYRAHHARTLSWQAKLMGYPTLLVGALLDVAVNIVIMSVVFMERPYEWLVTKRLARHIKTGGGWRRKLATWICQHLLNPFDPDQRGHCR